MQQLLTCLFTVFHLCYIHTYCSHILSKTCHLYCISVPCTLYWHKFYNVYQEEKKKGQFKMSGCFIIKTPLFIIFAAKWSKVMFDFTCRKVHPSLSHEGWLKSAAEHFGCDSEQSWKSSLSVFQMFCRYYQQDVIAWSMNLLISLQYAKTTLSPLFLLSALR